MIKFLGRTICGCLLFLPPWMLFCGAVDGFAKTHVTDVGSTVLVGYLFINITFSVIDPILDSLFPVKTEPKEE